MIWRVSRKCLFSLVLFRFSLFENSIGSGGVLFGFCFGCSNIGLLLTRLRLVYYFKLFRLFAFSLLGSLFGFFLLLAAAETFA